MTDLIGSFGPMFVVSAAVFGPLSGWFAGRRDRHPVVWLAFGALLGPLALLLLAAAPPGRCSMCDTRVHGWASICAVCGAPLTEAAGAGQYQAQDRTPIRPVTPAVDVELRPNYAPPPNPTMRTAPVLTMLSPHGVDSGVASDVPSPPIRLPVERPVASRIRRPDFSERPARSVTRPSYERDQEAAAEVLATGVYFGGTAGLAVGGRYVITRHGPLFRLLGPVDLDPARVALERPLGRLSAVAVGERLVITEGDGSRVSLAIGMGALAGMNGPELERALAPQDGSTADRRPASG
ncbi:MAG TPA: hypothetical protein VGQ02_03740 [Candidatus Limnocylindrales bacterium]|nr:hypothetical protein [Candidatus Limnocylindrales bacterium]